MTGSGKAFNTGADSKLDIGDDVSENGDVGDDVIDDGDDTVDTGKDDGEPVSGL